MYHHFTVIVAFDRHDLEEIPSAVRPEVEDLVFFVFCHHQRAGYCVSDINIVDAVPSS